MERGFEEGRGHTGHGVGGPLSCLGRQTSTLLLWAVWCDSLLSQPDGLRGAQTPC